MPDLDALAPLKGIASLRDLHVDLDFVDPAAAKPTAAEIEAYRRRLGPKMRVVIRSR